MSLKKEITTHLEYLGYEEMESKDEGYLIFLKKNYPLVCINCFESGIKFYARYHLNKYAAMNEESLMRFLNKLNMESYVVTYSFDEQENGIVFTSQIVGDYNKKNFLDFMNLWEYDVEDRLNAYYSESKLFLSSEDSVDSYQDPNAIYA